MTDKDYELWEQDINFIRMLREQNEQLEQENQQYKEVIDKTTNKLYEWGEALDPEFQKIMLDILKGDNK